MGMRAQILVRGTVQGVGFRPFVYSLAHQRELKGTVLNNPRGLVIDVEGEQESIDGFVRDIKLKPPPLSIVESVELKQVKARAAFSEFRIVESDLSGSAHLPVAADVATCDDCLHELFDPNNRRYRYPFINCTNCGPRFTIVESVPYDRERTTMGEFEMCAECRAEYENPTNRRFHAEPICCAKCGPTVSLFEPQRRRDAEKGRNTTGRECAGSVEIINSARKYLAEGKILAIKGLGGYHLACDATNAQAVAELRRRKYREDKPFALMTSSIEIIERYCPVSEDERLLLLSKERPIVLLEKPNTRGTLPTGRVSAFAIHQLPEAVAPRMKTLGFMLPYTPLHHLLLEGLDRPLVMTSGNISDEPIAYKDTEARERLNGIADLFVHHDRRIHIRTDDSVVRTLGFLPPSHRDAENGHQSQIANRKLQIVLRRSRGFAPTPVTTSFKFKKQILACGAELKNTFCLTRGYHAYISHHIGDLENLETLRSFTEGIEHFKKLFDLSPEVIAYDLHPEYLSTKYANACEWTDNKIGIQHHHAHIASCLADNKVEGEVIGVAMDGLGFGADGKLWGGEFFVADFKHAERIAHLDYIPLPGGAKAIREPWRLAAAYLQKTFGNEFLDLDIPFVSDLDHARWATVSSMIASDTNSPRSSSMGRLFDAISALLGVRNTVNYEGQAAIELEAMADEDASDFYEFELVDGGIIKAETVIKRAVEDLLEGRSASEISARFHLSVAKLIAQVAHIIRDEQNLNRVALSGGVFQNMLLLRHTYRLLIAAGFEVLIHRRVPTNDGGISFGQAAIANAKID